MKTKDERRLALPYIYAGAVISLLGQSNTYCSYATIMQLQAASTNKTLINKSLHVWLALFLFSMSKVFHNHSSD